MFPARYKRRRGVHKSRRTWPQHLREWVWPSMGWLAFCRWAELRIKRYHGSPHQLALGFAVGVFMVCTPFVGLHTLLALIAAFLVGGSLLAAALGTFFGNPWTYPVIWVTTYELGNLMLLRHTPEAFPDELDFKHMWQNAEFYFDAFILPMLVGCLPVGFGCGFLFYVLIRGQVKKYRAERKLSLERGRTP